MALQSGSAGTFKMVGSLLTPSLLSSLVAVVVGLIIVVGTILLARFSTGAEQSLTGLHSIYRQSSIGVDTSAVGQKLSGNGLFNNGILFILWGSVGLVVYSIVQSVVTEFGHTDDVLQEIHYVHADRDTILENTVIKASTRLAALAAWWIVAWTMLHKIFPYAIAAAHVATYTPGKGWLHALFGFCLCLIGVYALTVLLRLIVLRPRLIGNAILDS